MLLQKLRDKIQNGRMRPLTLVLILFVIIMVGAMAVGSMREQSAQLSVAVRDLDFTREKLARERDALQYEVSISDTDEYVIAKARQLYGYMMPNEILFIVKNTDALYGTGETVEMMVLEGGGP